MKMKKAATRTVVLSLLSIAAAASTSEKVSSYLRRRQQQEQEQPSSPTIIITEEEDLPLNGGGAVSIDVASDRQPQGGPSSDTMPSCNIDVTFGECPAPEPPTEIVNGCGGDEDDDAAPFRTVTFRYNGGNCLQSQNMQSRYDFSCDDHNGGPPAPLTELPPIETPSSSYITVTSRYNTSEIYFEGIVSVGDSYTINSNSENNSFLYPELANELTISVFENNNAEEDVDNNNDYEGQQLLQQERTKLALLLQRSTTNQPDRRKKILQQTNLELDCDVNDVFLYDRFGSNQIVAWEQTNGRIVETPNFEEDTVSTTKTASIPITITNVDSSVPVRLTEMTVLSNMDEDLPTSYTSEVLSLPILQPNESTSTSSLSNYEFEYESSSDRVRTKYTFFATAIGSSNANNEDPAVLCSDHAILECVL